MNVCKELECMQTDREKGEKKVINTKKSHIKRMTAAVNREEIKSKKANAKEKGKSKEHH